jgi:hypothetical protein
VRREVRSIHSNGATPPSRGCERPTFVSVRGSCPQITEQEAAADDDDNRYKERFHAALLFLLPERLTVGDSQLRRSPINIY